MERLSTVFANQQLDAIRADFANGVLAIYSGTQPASADDAETGDLLCLITQNGQPFTAGQPTNGLNFAAPSDGVMDKAGGEVWAGIILKSGVAGWFRFYDNNYMTGASTTAKRFDGEISPLSSAELRMSLDMSNMTEGDTLALETFQVHYRGE